MSFMDKAKKVFKFVEEHSGPVETSNTSNTNFGVNAVPSYNNNKRGIYVDAVTGEPVRSTSSNHLNATEYLGNYNGSQKYNGQVGNKFLNNNNQTYTSAYTANSSNVRFVPEGQMVAKGYGSYQPFLSNDDDNKN